MGTPNIRSAGSVHGTVTGGVGRNDLTVPEVVTFDDTEGANSALAHAWTLTDRPIGSSAVLVNPTSPSCTLTVDVTGSYRVTCIVGAAFSTVIVSVPLPHTLARIPSFEERVEYNGAGNNKGWHEAMTVFMRAVDTDLASMVVGAAYSTIENNGTPVTQRTTINLSTEFTASDASSKTALALATAGVGFSKLANGAALSVLGRSANSAGVMAAITASTDQVLRESGGTLGFGTIATGGIANNAVTLAKQAQMAGLSVPGVTGAATADLAAITAGTTGHVLRRSGTTLGFGTIEAGAIAGTQTNGFVTTLVAGVPTWTAAASSGANALGTYLVQTATNAPANAQVMAALATGFAKITTTTGVVSTQATIATADIANNAVTVGKMAQLAALSVLGNGTNATADVAAITAGTDGHVLRRAGTTVGFGTLAAGAFADTTITGAKLAGFTDQTIPVANSSGQLVSSPITLTSNLLNHSAIASSADVRVVVNNLSNTASASATIEVAVAGTSAGNPSWVLGIVGGVSWTGRVNNATGDQFELVAAATAVLKVTTVGNLVLGSMAAPAALAGGLCISNGTAASSNPVGGGCFEVISGALYWHGPTSAPTFLAPP